MYSKNVPGSAQQRPQTPDGKSVENADAQLNVQCSEGAQKRRRCSSKTKLELVACVQKEERSYARSWAQYIHGNVATQTSKRFITNLLTATAARVVEEPGDSSDDSDDFDYDPTGRPAGNMDLIRQTLNGISCRSDENGVEAIGRYATVIQLGRNLWQSPPLTPVEAEAATERFFDDGSLPPVAEVLKAAQEAFKNEEERPRPFNGSTQAWAQYRHTDLAHTFNDWFARIGAEEETPNTEQLAAVLQVLSRAVSTVVLFLMAMCRMVP